MLSQCEKAYKRYGTKTISLVIKMVSWGFAIKKGVIVFLWTIVWGIVGAVIGMVLGGAAIFGIISNPPADTSGLLMALIAIMGAFSIGSLVTIILSYATIVKITMESTLEEARKPGPP